MVRCTTCKVRFTIAAAEVCLMHLLVMLGGTSNSGKKPWPNTAFSLGASHRTARSDDHHQIKAFGQGSSRHLLTQPTPASNEVGSGASGPSQKPIKQLVSTWIDPRVAKCLG